MALADRVLRHAQALENQAMSLAKKLSAKSPRATAKLLREAAAELNEGTR